MLNQPSPLFKDAFIRAGTVDDLDSILALDAELTQDNWSKQKYQSVFDNDVPIELVIIDNQVAGVIIYLVCLDEIKILNLIVSKKYQRMHLATKLLERVLVDAYSKHEVLYVMLEVCALNYAAVQLYHTIGFRILCVREGYYRDKTIRDAYLMQFKLV